MKERIDENHPRVILIHIESKRIGDHLFSLKYKLLSASEEAEYKLLFMLSLFIPMSEECFKIICNGHLFLIC